MDILSVFQESDRSSGNSGRLYDMSYELSDVCGQLVHRMRTCRPTGVKHKYIRNGGSMIKIILDNPDGILQGK